MALCVAKDFFRDIGSFAFHDTFDHCQCYKYVLLLVLVQYEI